MKNGAHVLGPASNVLWINDIQQGDFKLWWFPERSHSLTNRISQFLGFPHVTTFLWYPTNVTENMRYLNKWRLFGAPYLTAPQTFGLDASLAETAKVEQNYFETPGQFSKKKCSWAFVSIQIFLLFFLFLLYGYFVSYSCARRTGSASAQSFTLWLEATIEITHRSHSVTSTTCLLHIDAIINTHTVCGGSPMRYRADRKSSSTFSGNQLSLCFTFSAV